MAGAEGALGGAAAGAAIGSVIPGVGTAIGAGAGALFGFFGGRRKDKKQRKLLADRFNEVNDPSFLQEQFLSTARQLAPSQSDILGRIRSGGLGLGQSSALSNRQFASEQNRARSSASTAFSQFQMQKQGLVQNALGGIIQNENFQQQRSDSFNNELLGAGLGFAGQKIGQGQAAPSRFQGQQALNSFQSTNFSGLTGLGF